MTEIKLAYGRQFARTKDGGWLEVGATLPKSSTAKISGDAIVFKRAARDMWGGTFMGGTFRGGDFCGGRFWGGEFNGGTFMGGEFNGGTFMGGYFRGGTFWGGTFMGGTFRGGTFRGGDFCGGDFWGGTFIGGDFFGGEFMGGDFCGGRFWGGEFNGGTFMGGEFNGGTFMGGYFRGGTFNLSPACAQRSDGYMFVAHFVEGELRIWAGCRNFSWNEAIDHWSDDHDHGAETQRIIHFLKAQAQAAKGIDYPNMETPA